jgi:hypothetical protein
MKVMSAATAVTAMLNKMAMPVPFTASSGRQALLLSLVIRDNKLSPAPAGQKIDGAVVAQTSVG